MAQTEMMFRLLKDGKIVGFERKALDTYLTNIEKKILTTYQRGIEKDSEWINDIDIIEHDSIELGIKVGDEWWFEGDRVLWNNEYEGILKYNPKRGFYFDLGGDGYSTFDTKHDYCKIDNIHEEKKP